MFSYRLLKRDIPKVEYHKKAKDWKKINHAIIVQKETSTAMDKIELNKNSRDKGKHFHVLNM